ncbi:MAG TPA: hypothetical protein VGR35_23775 [Tepidisphaeraceae bacterium]|nr:hypothetical protein [Tepidisphaeraceae bacterium]
MKIIDVFANRPLAIVLTLIALTLFGITCYFVRQEPDGTRFLRWDVAFAIACTLALLAWNSLAARPLGTIALAALAIPLLYGITDLTENVLLLQTKQDRHPTLLRGLFWAKFILFALAVMQAILLRFVSRGR